MSTQAASKLFASTLALSMALMTVGAFAEEAAQVKEVVVQGKRAASVTAGLGGLGLGLKETPQSVTVISQEMIKDLSLKNANDALDLVPGVNVERVETDRTFYNARGFNVTTTQVDGVGLPLSWGIQYGAQDTVLFDRIEVLRGAGGLTTSTGNPSATLNYVRKRPTRDARGEVSGQLGSWDFKRVELDVSGPVPSTKDFYGRVIAASEDKGSYLDHYHTNRNVVSVLGSWDVTQKLTVDFGYALQDHRARGILWGALPLTYSDGGRVPYDKGASTSADWTYWNTKSQQAYGSIAYGFAPNWLAKASVNLRQDEQTATLLYAMGAPDRKTGLGVKGLAGQYPSTTEEILVDAQVSGTFVLGGRAHDVTVGASSSKGWSDQDQARSPDAIDYGPVLTWGRRAPAEPRFPALSKAEKTRESHDRFYGAARLNLTDTLKVVVGASAMKVEVKGFSYGADKGRKDDAISPFAGVLYDVTPNVTLYASYTDIFNPQTQVDQKRNRLKPAKGSNLEAGLKSDWFNKRLSVSAAVFQGEQKGLAEYAGSFDDGKSFYKGLDTKVSGYELEINGKITPVWSVGGGYTDLSIDKQAGKEVRPYLPRRSLKLMTTYQVPQWRDLKVSGAVRWQDEIKSDDDKPIVQAAYAVVDLSASAKLTDKVRASVQVKNLFDERYLTSLMWSQSFAAAPRSVYGALSYSF